MSGVHVIVGAISPSPQPYLPAHYPIFFLTFLRVFSALTKRFCSFSNFLRFPFGDSVSVSLGSVDFQQFGSVCGGRENFVGFLGDIHARAGSRRLRRRRSDSRELAEADT